MSESERWAIALEHLLFVDFFMALSIASRSASRAHEIEVVTSQVAGIYRAPTGFLITVI